MRHDPPGSSPQRGKDDLEAALRRSAVAPAPTPDRSFVDDLEQRLLNDGAGRVVPFARRARRVGTATVVAITCTVAGVAAAAGIVVTHPFSGEAPAPTTVPVSPVTVTSTSVASAASTEVATTAPLGQGATTIAVAVAAEPSTSVPPAAPAATVAATTPPTAAAATTIPPPATSAATTVATSPPTTEVHVPATLTLSCAANGSSIECGWSAAPAGTVHFVVLRSTPGLDLPGRAFTVDASVTSWTDPMADAGVTYTYLVHALDGADHSLGHSPAVSVGCC